MKLAVLAAGALLAAACAHLDEKPRGAELFAVVPAPDGHVGAIVVHGAGQSHVIDTAYGAQRLDAGGFHATAMSREQVQATFGDTLSALPGQPARFTLYFLEGRDELTPESKAELERVFEELKRRPLPDVAVIGHTDTVGSPGYNDRLSAARAERMREILVRLGLPPERITAAGRGKREPLIATGDNVAEPRNRRVEIDVR
ncbi:MAG TPA: OmpA family protein [Usitatibacter sp.]|nr:OmpA family protein [Usitatibacter sp.]